MHFIVSEKTHRVIAGCICNIALGILYRPTTHIRIVYQPPVRDQASYLPFTGPIRAWASSPGLAEFSIYFYGKEDDHLAWCKGNSDAELDMPPW